MITVYSKDNCPFCDKAKKYLKENSIEFIELNIAHDNDARNFLLSQGHKTVPQIYRGEDLIVEGGWNGLSKMPIEELKMKAGIAY